MRMKNILFHLYSFILCFAGVGFIITCSFYVLFQYIELSEAQVRAFAPVVFINAFAITAVLMIIDGIRRKLTVDKKVKEIQDVLMRLMKGDYTARISISSPRDTFDELSESINLLASELSGVETLRDDFIANVSHELKTPLAVISNYGTMLQNPELSNEERLEYARSITRTSKKLADLIANILKLNKLENQQIFPESNEYDLSEQLCQCLLQFEDIWEEKGINIETDITDCVRVNADSQLLSLVWNNLLSNAFKFTDKGGRVFVELTADEDTATVKIKDTGCGMTRQVGEHIFEKFYQGDASHSAKGNGLGLALVKRVVDIMHAQIEVESVFGEGSVFTVKLKRH